MVSELERALWAMCETLCEDRPALPSGVCMRLGIDCMDEKGMGDPAEVLREVVRDVAPSRKHMTCPFCGGRPLAYVTGPHVAKVECTSCGAVVSHFEPWDEPGDKDLLEMAWGDWDRHDGTRVPCHPVGRWEDPE